MIKLKNQRGSATLFVLIAVLFFSIILIGIYNSNMNKLQAQDRDVLRIKQAYDKDANEIYEETIEKSSE